MRSCCITQGAQSGVLWWLRSVGLGEGREMQEVRNIERDIYNYGWFMLLYGRNQHIIKIKKQKIIKKESERQATPKDTYLDYIKNSYTFLRKTQITQ